MSIADESAKGVKTLGIRLNPDVHAQLSFIAQLRPGKGTITDEIQIAIAEHIARATEDPELRSRADAARAEIEREAAARRAAIANLFATTELPSEAGGSGDDEPGQSQQSRRGQKGGSR